MHLAPARMRSNPDHKIIYDILKSETERVARIVRQMLGLYRNNEQVKPVNINSIVEDTLVLLNRQLQRANVMVDVELATCRRRSWRQTSFARYFRIWSSMPRMPCRTAADCGSAPGIFPALLLGGMRSASSLATRHGHPLRDDAEHLRTFRDY